MPSHDASAFGNVNRPFDFVPLPIHLDKIDIDLTGQVLSTLPRNPLIGCEVSDPGLGLLTKEDASQREGPVKPILAVVVIREEVSKENQDDHKGQDKNNKS